MLSPTSGTLSALRRLSTSSWRAPAPSPCSPPTRRRFSSRASRQLLEHPSFAFWPAFFSEPEQRVLLRAALQKLDGQERPRARRRQRDHLRAHAPHEPPRTGTPPAEFCPDELYTFQEARRPAPPRRPGPGRPRADGHYDGVIRRYREMLVTAWPEDAPEVRPLLERLRRLHPAVDTHTHLLHLASDGQIDPHVDHVDAFGSWILGVSLGDERTLRLQSHHEGGGEPVRYELALPSGSVYMQRCAGPSPSSQAATNAPVLRTRRDELRYHYTHAILPAHPSRAASGGQRVSIMIRDRLPPGSPPTAPS
ncbi:uncharacterized protein BXZ73DRAFT_95487 [Epithele typhae]|uniref:uncharacterized protein n=1 Tax=Epithele typhae TaxID=378194 RepID=UPI0020082564|nr:uncharacterized protein BXZ73DRAFT_95487 [Epithele typhae]KAH9945971.1 hypothetical protein BXZ73DRAFT_95487 [Epithele typhae]